MEATRPLAHSPTRPLAHSPTRPLAHSLVAAFMLGGLCAQAGERPLPGQQPGSERWILWLRDRGYDLQTQLQTVRAAPTRAQREQLIANLDQIARNDQSLLTQAVQANGGVVTKNFWALSALSVEVPPAAVGVLAALPRVRRMVPVRPRGHASKSAIVNGAVAIPVVKQGPGYPADSFGGTNNHNIGTARSIIVAAMATDPTIPVGAERGAGVRIAVLDTGVDQDAGGFGGTNGPHDAFVDAALASRIDAHLRGGVNQTPGFTQHPFINIGEAIDCNNIGFSGGFSGVNPPAVAYRPCWHSISALHGTSMAYLAAGNATGSFLDGHAPAARVLDVSVSEVPNDPARDRALWTSSDATMLNAVQLVRAFVEVSGENIHVVNLSFDGWSDPLEPVAVALDELALDHDLLVITSGGNEADLSRFSNGFYNGLAVGAVHARREPAEPFEPLGQTVRGPLFSDWTRFYPDVCATGGGPGNLASQVPVPFPQRFEWGDRTSASNAASYLAVPLIDLRDSCATAAGTINVGTGFCQSTCSSTQLGQRIPFGIPMPGAQYTSLGTSPAAAQVSGAAALYRAVRPSASAEETRAALLLNTLSPRLGANGSAQHTYASRNTFGVGYVRDDFVAEFAVRQAAIQPVAGTVTLSASVVEGSVALPVLNPGDRYAVVCSWPRRFSVDGEYVADIDLQVREIGNPASVIARSVSRGNTYEHVSFLGAASDGGFEAHVRIESAPTGLGAPLPVQVVARRFEPDLDPATAAIVEFTPVHSSTGTVESLTAGPGSGDCVATARSLGAMQTVPLAYSGAWGSGPVGLPVVTPASPTTPATFTMPTFRGFNLGGIPPQLNGGSLPWSLHIEVSNAQVGGALGIGGIAMRAWRPFQRMGSGGSPLQVTAVYVAEGPVAGPVNPNSTNSLLRNPPLGSTVFSGALTLPALSTDAGNVLQAVARNNNHLPVVVPFTSTFQYSGAMNLHVWIAFGNAGQPANTVYEVDFASDFGAVGYGSSVATNGPGGQIATLGRCPVLMLLTHVTPVANTTPALECLGHPTIGRGLELYGRDMPASLAAILFLGDFSPFSSVVGTCHGHVIPFQGQSWFGTSSSAGYVRWATPAWPTDPALISQVVGYQAILGNNTLTNAVKVTIGGDR